MAVRHGQEQFLAQPFRPQDLLLLFAGGTEAPTPAREGNEDAPSALGAPKAGEPVLEQPALQELQQHSFDHRAQLPVLPLEPGWPDSQHLLEVLLHEAVKQRLAWPPRLVDTAADLHAQPTAGGRGTGDKRERPSRPALPTRVAVWATHWSDEVPSLTP